MVKFVTYFETRALLVIDEMRTAAFFFNGVDIDCLLENSNLIHASHHLHVWKNKAILPTTITVNQVIPSLPRTLSQ